MTPPPKSRGPERISTTIPSLDSVLGGGLIRGSASLVMGAAGTGKTVLGNQLAFGHVAAGGRALFIAHRGETHDRMIMNMRGMTFFNADVIGRELSFLNGMGSLDAGGMAALQEMVVHAINHHRASLLVVDGLLTAELSAESATSFQRFVQNLQSHASLLGCTTVLLSTAVPGHDDEGMGNAQVIVDGLLQLHHQRHGLRVALELEIAKLRGSAHLPGRHVYELGRQGITVYPRIEAIAGTVLAPPTGPTARASSGIAVLDEMAGGGFLTGSTTLVLGPAGSGKTLIGLHFLVEGARRNEPGVLVGFYEPPAYLLQAAGEVGLELEEHVKSGMIEIAWHPRREQIIDKVGGDMLARVRRRSAKRLFVDSLSGFEHAAMHPDRMSDFFAAISNELRGSGITTLWSDETHEPQGPDLHLNVANVSAICENIVLLHSVATPRELYRFITLRKVRASAFDSSVHELWITHEGIRVAPTAESAIARLEGLGRGGRT